jgi:hypothetical protein
MMAAFPTYPDLAVPGALTLMMLPEAEKLTAVNWYRWKGTMISILRMKGLLGYVEGTVPIPIERRQQPLPLLPFEHEQISGSIDSIYHGYTDKGKNRADKPIAGPSSSPITMLAHVSSTINILVNIACCF